jgi:hypothetical protein
MRTITVRMTETSSSKIGTQLDKDGIIDARSLKSKDSGVLTVANLLVDSRDVPKGLRTIVSVNKKIALSLTPSEAKALGEYLIECSEDNVEETE